MARKRRTYILELKRSGDLDRYWDFHHRREMERNHLKHYAAHEMIELREAA